VQFASAVSLQHELLTWSWYRRKIFVTNLSSYDFGGIKSRSIWVFGQDGFPDRISWQSDRARGNWNQRIQWRLEYSVTATFARVYVAYFVSKSLVSESYLGDIQWDFILVLAAAWSRKPSDGTLDPQFMVAVVVVDPDGHVSVDWQLVNQRTMVRTRLHPLVCRAGWSLGELLVSPLDSFLIFA